MATARSPIPRALAASAAALALACAASACGTSDPVADALEQQTVTVTLPAAAPSASTAPNSPQQAPPAPGSDDGSGSSAAPDPTDPPAGGNGAATAVPVPAGSAESEGPASAAGPGDPGTGDAGAAAAQGGAAPGPQPRPTVHLTRSTALRATPGGEAIARVAPTTEFRSPTVLAVVRQRGGWLGVLSSALPNGRIGWISARATFEVHRNGYSVDASLKRREVVVRRNGRIVQRFPVAIGGEGTPTPQGRFAVTDKLMTGSASSPYGCCILALSGHQSATPQGWGGGDRIAIHATNLPETIGTRASLGCLRAPTDSIRRAVNTVPLGTIVTIHA